MGKKDKNKRRKIAKARVAKERQQLRSGPLVRGQRLDKPILQFNRKRWPVYRDLIKDLLVEAFEIEHGQDWSHITFYVETSHTIAEDGGVDLENRIFMGAAGVPGHAGDYVIFDLHGEIRDAFGAVLSDWWNHILTTDNHTGWDVLVGTISKRGSGYTVFSPLFKDEVDEMARRDPYGRRKNFNYWKNAYTRNGSFSRNLDRIHDSLMDTMLDVAEAGQGPMMPDALSKLFAKELDAVVREVLSEQMNGWAVACIVLDASDLTEKIGIRLAAHDAEESRFVELGDTVLSELDQLVDEWRRRHVLTGDKPWQTILIILHRSLPNMRQVIETELGEGGLEGLGSEVLDLVERFRTGEDME